MKTASEMIEFVLGHVVLGQRKHLVLLFVHVMFHGFPEVVDFRHEFEGARICDRNLMTETSNLLMLASCLIDFFLRVSRTKMPHGRVKDLLFRLRVHIELTLDLRENGLPNMRICGLLERPKEAAHDSVILLQN